jgi:hypothetical protein
MGAPDDVAAEAAALLTAFTEAAEVVPAGARITSDDPTTAARLGSLTKAVGRSARSAGAGAVASGQWLAQTVVDLGEQLPVRGPDVLVARYGGLHGDALAEALIRAAARASASVGATAGAVVAAEELLPPAWLMVPLEILVETALVAGVEMKLIGELHEVYGQPVVEAPGQRAYALGRAWAERRGVGPALLVSGSPALAGTLGHQARSEVIRLVRRRLVRRAGVNLSGLAPFLVGAAAGAALNAHATRRLGEAVQKDLRA